MAELPSTPRAALALLKSLGGGSKLVAALVALTLACVLGVSAWVAKQPHFELLYSGLDASDSAKVQKALSEAGLDFEASQPPGPFSVYVDSSDRRKAFGAVAKAGALAGKSGGISTGDSGMASVFLSQAERSQVVRKRDWEETEILLEGLDFVADARVRTSEGDAPAWGKSAPVKASVALTLRGRSLPTEEQTLSVASLVRNALGVEPADLVVTDQYGNCLYDGSAQTGDAAESAAWLSHKSRYDRDLAERANRLLSEILGPDKARVVVSSDWSFEQSSTITEEADPDKRVPVSEQTSLTTAPGNGAGLDGVGGPAGTASNLAGDGFGVEHAATGAGTSKPGAAAGSEPITKSSEETRNYFVPKSTTATINRSPTLTRLSVSLFIDESLVERQKELEASVKAAVGFDAARKDIFGSVHLAFASPEGVDSGAGTVGTKDSAQPASKTEDKAPSRLMQLLLERGVEIVCAVAFVLVLLRTLRGPRTRKKKDGTTAGQPAEEPPAELVPVERLARAQVEELVKKEPERVGKILSEWARSERAGAGNGR